MSTEIINADIVFNSEIVNTVEVPNGAIEAMGDVFGPEVVSQSVGMYEKVANGLKQLDDYTNERTLEIVKQVLDKESLSVMMEAIRNIDPEKLGINFGIGVVVGAFAGGLLSTLGRKTLIENGTSEQDVNIASFWVIITCGLLGGAIGGASTFVQKK